MASTLQSSFSSSCYRSVLMMPAKMRLMGTGPTNFSSNIRLKSLILKASNSGGEDESSMDSNGLSKEDLSYLWKLGAGSVVGAAVIKYGSVLFPEITRPDIFLALIMISTPTIVAIWLLIKQSRSG